MIPRNLPQQLEKVSTHFGSCHSLVHRQDSGMKTSTKRISATFILAVTVTILGAVFYFNATPAEKRLQETVSKMPVSTDPTFLPVMQALLSNAILDDNKAEIMVGGDEIFPALLEAIQEAERSVNLEIYEYYGEIAMSFAEALADKAKDGVPVQVIMDYIGSRKADEKAFDLMEDAGVNLVRWRDPSWYRSSRFNFRTHRKLLVIDGQVAFTGGSNMGG